MKHSVLAVCIALLSCNSGGSTYTQRTAVDITSAAGIIIAADSQFIIEEKPNDFYFSVNIETTETSARGNYLVNATWGRANAQGHLTMPKGLEHKKPVIHKTEQPYSYLIGFYLENDTTFYDYFLITAERGMIKMRYVKAYTFD